MEVKMDSFTFLYPTKVYFGVDAAQKDLINELNRYGKNVLFAYGKASIKKNGIYEEMMDALNKTGKNVTEFSGIMPNPTYEKVLEGAKLCKENDIDFILAVGGGSVSDCCKIVSAQAKLEEDIWNLKTTDSQANSFRWAWS